MESHSLQKKVLPMGTDTSVTRILNGMCAPSLHLLREAHQANPCTPPPPPRIKTIQIHMKKQNKTQKSGLRARVEVSLPNPTTSKDTTLDGMDSDLLSHVSHFLQTPIPPMENFSLATREGALEALAIMENTQRFLEDRIRTAKILKALCEDSIKNEQ